jgi:hypothetical protein
VLPGVDKYNAVMEDYFDKLNGKDWNSRMEKRLDSMRNSKQSY